MPVTRYRFNRGASGLISGTVTDPATGSAVDAAQLTAAMLTLFDLGTGVLDASPVEGIINSRDRQDILALGSSPLGDHDVSYGTAGAFTWMVQPEDNIVVTSRRQIERHRAVFEFDWDSGRQVQEFEIEVVNVKGA